MIGACILIGIYEKRLGEQSPSHFFESPNPPSSGKDTVEGKDVHREVEAKGSRTKENPRKARKYRLFGDWFMKLRSFPLDRT